MISAGRRGQESGSAIGGSRRTGNHRVGNAWLRLLGVVERDLELREGSDRGLVRVRCEELGEDGINYRGESRGAGAVGSRGRRDGAAGRRDRRRRGRGGLRDGGRLGDRLFTGLAAVLLLLLLLLVAL